jgi:hypothetical protein
VTDITIRIGGPGDALPSQDNSSSLAIVQTSRKATGSRHSKRLRQVKEHGERRRLTVSKITTVKEIKVTVSHVCNKELTSEPSIAQLQDELNIPTICQRLFYHGQELDDSSASVGSIGILANDILDLREESEDNDHLNSDTDVSHVKKKRRQEERGFSGTLLGGSKSDEGHDDGGGLSTTDPTDEKICSACTFANPPDVTSCGVCDTSFN